MGMGGLFGGYLPPRIRKIFRKIKRLASHTNLKKNGVCDGGLRMRWPALTAQSR
jgi:hypothetical protein